MWLALGSVAAVVAAVAALWVPIVKILKGWWEASEAKAKACKAQDEALAARINTQRIQADTERASCDLGEADRAKEHGRRIAVLAQTIREYADRQRREAKNRNLVFSSSELAMQLGDDLSQFEDVMRWLEHQGYAKKSWVPERWEIDAPHLTPKDRFP